MRASPGTPPRRNRSIVATLLVGSVLACAARATAADPLRAADRLAGEVRRRARTVGQVVRAERAGGGGAEDPPGHQPHRSVQALRAGAARRGRPAKTARRCAGQGGRVGRAAVASCGATRPRRSTRWRGGRSAPAGRAWPSSWPWPRSRPIPITSPPGGCSATRSSATSGGRCTR